MTFNSNKFTFDPEARMFITEASDLGRGEMFQQIYSDAADIGLTLVSEKTGAEAQFVLTGEKRDSEGELQSWELVPTPESIRSQPGLAGTKMVIFND